MNSDHVWRAAPVALAVALVVGLAGGWPDRSSGRVLAESPPPTEPVRLATADLRAAYAGPPERWPPFVVDEGVDAAELGVVPPVPFPDDNPYTEDKAKLGEQLFYDPRLSRTHQMSCASCHDPDLGWADGRTVSFGRDRLPLKRNAPTVLGTGHFDRLFWDGRADSLEDLTLKVITNADEMHGVGDMVASKIGMIP
ncbi:MAG: cytochrome-c peroxidase, partial [Planctomycetota bacterium]